MASIQRAYLFKSCSKLLPQVQFENLVIMPQVFWTGTYFVLVSEQFLNIWWCITWRSRCRLCAGLRIDRTRRLRLCTTCPVMLDLCFALKFLCAVCWSGYLVYIKNQTENRNYVSRRWWHAMNRFPLCSTAEWTPGGGAFPGAAVPSPWTRGGSAGGAGTRSAWMLGWTPRGWQQSRRRRGRGRTSQGGWGGFSLQGHLQHPGPTGPLMRPWRSSVSPPGGWRGSPLQDISSIQPMGPLMSSQGSSSNKVLLARPVMRKETATTDCSRRCSMSPPHDLEQPVWLQLSSISLQWKLSWVTFIYIFQMFFA